MAGPLVVIFHQPPRADDPPLTRLLAEARDVLLAHHAWLFERVGAGRMLVVPGRRAGSGESFGLRLANLVDEEGVSGGLVVLGSGAVPLLGLAVAARLVAVARSGERRALTNNRYSSDVCAVGDASVLHDLPPLPSDNALPRWLEERAGFHVTELPGHDRLAIDLDTPLDLLLLALARGCPAALTALAADAGIEIPRRDELRALAADPRRELLVFGRSGSLTLRWLERNVRCRVRFLAEERGLRASSPLAIGEPGTAETGPATTTASAASAPTRPPRATLGRLLELRGPDSLAETVAELGEGAILDTRVLMADRFGPDEDAWPSAEDRFASDLLRTDSIANPWLRALTVSAAGSALPILLGAHTLVGPGIPLVLRADQRARRRPGAAGSPPERAAL